MVMSKYSPAERLMRKRVAARLRQQRCRARKRAAAAAAKKQDTADSSAGDQSVTSASTAESTKNSSKPQRAPTKIVVSNTSTAQGARFLPPQPRAPVFRGAVPPHYPHPGTSQHPLAPPTHWDPFGAPHLHYAYGAHGHIPRPPPPPCVIYEVHHRIPTAYGVPPPLPQAHFPPTSHPHHPSVAARSDPPSSIEFPATVSRASSRDESTGSNLSSPSGSPESTKTHVVKTHMKETKGSKDDTATPSTTASSPPKSLLLSNEKAAIDGMLCLGRAADQVEKASA